MMCVNGMGEGDKYLQCNSFVTFSFVFPLVKLVAGLLFFLTDHQQISGRTRSYASYSPHVCQPLKRRHMISTK